MQQTPVHAYYIERYNDERRYSEGDADDIALCEGREPGGKAFSQAIITLVALDIIATCYIHAYYTST